MLMPSAASALWRERKKMTKFSTITFLPSPIPIIILSFKPTLNVEFSVTKSYLCCSILVGHCLCQVSLTLKVNLTLFVIPCQKRKKEKKRQKGVIDLRCCDYYLSLSGFSSKFQSSMTTFCYRFVRIKNLSNFVSVIGMDLMHYATSYKQQHNALKSTHPPTHH